MAMPLERNIELSLQQKVAVAEKYLPKPGGELIDSELAQAPQGLEKGMTAFEFDSLGGVQKIYTQDAEKWHEIFLLGPIRNRRRELIAKTFGFDPNNITPLTVIEQTGPFQREKNYFIIT